MIKIKKKNIKNIIIKEPIKKKDIITITMTAHTKKENTITIILPPAEDEDPDLDIDLREDLGAEMMPIGIEIDRILHADGGNDQFGIIDIVLDEYGSNGTHIAILTNEIEESIAVSFQAILGTVDYLPGADAEIPQW